MTSKVFTKKMNRLTSLEDFPTNSQKKKFICSVAKFYSKLFNNYVENKRSSELERLEVEQKIVEKGLDQSNEEAFLVNKNNGDDLKQKYDELKKEKEDLERRLVELNFEIGKLKDVENENSLLQIDNDAADFSGK